MMALRFVTAIGVGAEYAAINAAISEFIPARHRGKTNATVMNFWSVGAIFAALVTLLLINRLPPDWVDVQLSASVLSSPLPRRSHAASFRNHLLARGDAQGASAVVDDIEHGRFAKSPAPASPEAARESATRRSFWSQSRTLLRQHPGRLALGCALDFSEAAGYYGLFAFLALFILPSV